jgi:adenylate cyclase
MARLIISAPDASRREVDLVGNMGMGRHPAQEIQILDRLVSKSHARIEERSGEVFALVDLGSRNGTFLNGQIVTDSKILEHGDVIMIGATKLTYEAPAEVRDETERVELSDMAVTSAVRSTLDSTSAMEFSAAEEIDDVSTLRRDYEKLRMAHIIRRELALELDLDVLLDRTLGLIFEFFPGVGRGIALLLDEATGQLEIRKVQTRKKTSTDEKVVLSNTIVQEVLKDRKAVLSSDALMDSRFDQAKSIILQGIRSTMTVPMMGYDGRVVGILHLDSSETTGVFGDTDLSVVQSFATQVAMSIENVFLTKQIEAEAENRNRLQRFLSPNLVDKVLSGDMVIEKGGEMKQVSILFSDIRSFTPLSERHEAQRIVGLLNDYFEAMVEIIFQHQGTLDKFVGDEIMALWGAPISTPEDPVMAVGAAVRMQQQLKILNQHFKNEFGDILSVGIGIDTGPVVAGLMGSSRTLSYTVIGQHVNRAARLCSAAKAGEILISEDTWRLVKNNVICEPVEPLELKGISKPVPTWRVTDVR